MGAITESLAGDELVIVGVFYACPEGKKLSGENRRRFRLGDRVRFAGFYRDEGIEDNPVCWMIRFAVASGNAPSRP